MQKLIDDVWVDCTQDDLVIGDTYRIPVGNGGWQQQAYAGPQPNPIEIIITAIVGVEVVNGSLTKATCFELTPFTVSGTLDIDDQVFALPIRRDDGRLFLFPVEVAGGEFTAAIDFPTTGQFTYSDDECNIDLPYKMFTVNTITFDVLRQAGT